MNINNIMNIIEKIETNDILNLFLLLCFRGKLSDVKGILSFKILKIL